MSQKLKTLRDEFESLRSVCEDNPALFFDDAALKPCDYPHLQDAHFAFYKAYAHVKMSNLQKAQEIIEGVLSKAVLEEDYFLMVHGNMLLSNCFRSDHQKQQLCLKMAEDYARQSGDSESLAEVFSAQGDLLHSNQQYQDAEKRHLLSQKILAKLDSPAHTIRSLYSLSLINLSLKHPKKAIAYLKDALLICRDKGFEKHEVITLNKLAIIQMNEAHYKEAEALLENVIRLCEHLGITIQKIQAIFSLGAMYLKMHKPDLAFTRLNEAASLAAMAGFCSPLFELDLSYNMGEVFRLKEDWQEALIRFKSALAIAKEHQVIDAEPEILIAIADIYIKQKNYTEAESLLKHALKIAPKFEDNSDRDEIWDQMAKLYRKMRDYPRCLDALQKHNALLRGTIKRLLEERQESLRDHIDFACSSTCKSPQEDISDDIYGFVGAGDAHKRILKEALLAAQYANVNVILMGESGTGKEVLANIIHQHSLRKYQNFVPFNAAAISANLVESQLFGHVKGSFTGAVCDNKGFFHKAHKGTLFIDEISEMPLDVQAKMLRALESKKIIPVGSNTEISIDCRIISATNLNIYDLIKTNHFRLDLFHRINTIEIFIPPLRERVEDIPALVTHYAKHFSKEFNKPMPRIEQSFVDSLQKYAFPGNVRELKNIIERLFIMGDNSSWDADLLLRVSGIAPKPATQNNHDSKTATNEEELIREALIRCNGVQTEVAKLLNISNSTLTRRISLYKLDAFTRKGGRG